MTREELRKLICSHFDRCREEIIRSGEALLRMPELSYREKRTAAFAEKVLHSAGLTCRKGLAVTGARADLDTGRPGPKVALLGELDAIIVPNHPFADPVTHAAHACGHHAALNAMLSCAALFTRPEVLSCLSGSIAFITTPSEECQDQSYISSLAEKGEITFFGGKSQLIAEGVFDDTDIAVMLHAGGSNFTPSGFNGFVMKRLIFEGKSAHAGANPDKGVNAISMMRSAMNLLDAQRDTFRDEDHVRIHGYIPDGGEAVNVVPDRCVFTLQVRAGSPEAVRSASEKVDRCVHAASLAFGGRAEVRNIFGFMPLVPYAPLDEIHEANCRFIAPDAPFTRGVYRPSSTDMGDVSMIRPSLHAYFRGFDGTAHTDSFLVKDPVQAYVDSAKVLALDLADLLFGGAEKAKEIAKLHVPMTKEQYLTAMHGFSSVRRFGDAEKDKE